MLGFGGLRWWGRYKSWDKLKRAWRWSEVWAYLYCKNKRVNTTYRRLKVHKTWPRSGPMTLLGNVSSRDRVHHEPHCWFLLYTLGLAFYCILQSHDHVANSTK